MRFEDLGLREELTRAVTEVGFQAPSPIQQQAIPVVLEGRDLMATAQTGTGKTAGFSLPLLQRLSMGHKASANHVRALILTPTRELASQVAESITLYGRYLPLRSMVVFGGVKINPQMMGLRRGADILVATPGRLLDLYQQNAIKFNKLEALVLDEADRMLDMGFIHDIKRIVSLLPANRQNLMFSATFSDAIRKLAKSIVQAPVEVSASPQNTTANTVKHWLHPVDKKKKSPLLLQLIKDNAWQQVLVFTKTKHGANKLVRDLEKAQIKSAAIHGNKSQGARTRALADFKSGAINILVATDIAARGLDIDQLPQVVNFDLPQVAEDYVHRVGRTGRAGFSGVAVSLVSADEFLLLESIEKLLQQRIAREYVDGFEPEHDIPEPKSSLKARSGQAKNTQKKNTRKQKSAPRNSENRSNQSSAKKASGSQSKANPKGGRTDNPQRQPRRRKPNSKGQRPAPPAGRQS